MGVSSSGCLWHIMKPVRMDMEKGFPLQLFKILLNNYLLSIAIAWCNFSANTVSPIKDNIDFMPNFRLAESLQERNLKYRNFGLVWRDCEDLKCGRIKDERLIWNVFCTTGWWWAKLGLLLCSFRAPEAESGPGRGSFCSCGIEFWQIWGTHFSGLLQCFMLSPLNVWMLESEVLFNRMVVFRHEETWRAV